MNLSLSKILNIFLLFTLGILAIYKSPILQSLWIDETLTYWVASSSFLDVFKRSFYFQGQSPLYYLVVYFVKGLYSNELILRIPSLLFTLLSSIYLFKLSNKLFKGSGFITLIAFISSYEILFSAFNARPYALGVLGVSASTYYLNEWIRNNKSLFPYLISILITFYAHYLFSPIILIHILYFLIKKKELGLARKQVFKLVIIYLFFIVLSLPGIYHLVFLLNRQGELNYILPATFNKLLKEISNPVVLNYLLPSFIIGLIFTKFSVNKDILKKHSSLILVLLIYLLPIFIFFIHSKVSNSSLFISRYFLWNYVGVSLLSGFLYSLLKSSLSKNVFVIILVILVFNTESKRVWHLEDWKSAINLTNQNNPSLVLWYPSIIESNDISILKDKENYSYLTSPMSFYKLNSKPFLIPGVNFTQEQKNYYKDLFINKIKAKNSFILIFKNHYLSNQSGNKILLSNIIFEEFKKYGFVQSRIIKDTDVCVVEFKRLILQT